ncbi:MAG: hypothetical protein J7L88_05025, partial [Thermoplasmata archaeon]|nr:hypothetical protein [Thermoplasmata archaeon]
MRNGKYVWIFALMMTLVFLFPPIPSVFSTEGGNLPKDEAEPLRTHENPPPQITSDSIDPYESLYWERYGYPNGRETPTMGYMESEGKVYIYGGGYITRSSAVAYGDMWVVNLSTGRFDALLLDPSPEGRVKQYSAYNPWHHKIFVYGGFGEYQIKYSDLWEFDMMSKSWKRLLSSSNIPLRYDGAMVYYKKDNCLFLLAGKDYNGENVTDFYKLDLYTLTYTQLTVPESFLPRFGHSMAIDEDRGVIYVMGGRNRVYGRLSEFWKYEISTGTWTSIDLPSYFEYQEGGTIFYRSDVSAVYLWGGRVSSSSYTNKMCCYYTTNHTWALINGTGSIPSGRAYFGHCYSDQYERLFVFGGSRGYSRYNQLFYMDLDTHHWTDIPTKSIGTTRSGLKAFRIKGTPYIYFMNVFRSSYSGRIYFYRWNLSSMEWEVVYNRSDNEGPHYRYHSGWVYDDARGKIYMYGGYYSYGYRPTHYVDYADLWEYDIATNTWTLLFENSAPGKRYDLMFILDKDTNTLYVYGGKYHSNGDVMYRTTMWELNLNMRIWKKVSHHNGPNGLAGMSYVYVREKKGVYVFGGVNFTGYLDYFWFFHIPTANWSRIYGVSHPSIKEGAGMIYDPLTEEIYMYGGSTGYGGSTDFHVFRSKEMRWRTLFITPDAGSRNYPAMLFDEESRYIYMAGGGPSGLWRMYLPPRVSPLTPHLYSPEGMETNVALARYGTYKFVLPLRLINDMSDTTGVMLKILTRKGGEIRFFYNLSSSKGEELYDPYEQTELVSSDHHYVEMGSIKMLNVTMNILFNWTFTDSRLVDIVFEALPGRIMGDSVRFPEFFRVSGDLTIRGEPVIVAEWQGRLHNDSWVRTSENFTFTNFSIVYSEFPDLSPQDSSCFLSIADDEGHVTNVTHRRGVVFNVSMRAKNTTDNLVLYTFRIGGIPPERDLSDVKFYLHVDGTPPTPPAALLIHADAFDDPQTSSDNDTELYVSWNPALDPHSGIAGYYYSTVDRSGTTEGEFTDGREVKVTAPGEGIYKIYVWAVDKVGNIGMASMDDIFVDMTPPTFSNPTPPPEQIYPFKENVPVGITIADPFGAGIDQFSIYYRYSTTGPDGFSDWENVPMESSMMVVNVSIRLNLAEGDDNYVQWKATDMAGNTNISEVYRIHINTSMKYPRVTLLSPENNTVLSAADYIVLQWSVDYYDPEAVTYDLYLGKELATLGSFAPYAKDITKTNYTITHLMPGKYYWKVVPKAKGWTGWCTPPYLAFEVQYSTERGLEVTGLPDSVEVQQGRSRAISVTIRNTGEANEEVTVEITSDLPGVSLSESRFMLLAGDTKTIQILITVDKDQALGNYTITLTLTGSEGSYAEANFTVRVVEYQKTVKEEKEKKNLTPYLIIVGVLAAAGIVAYLFLKKGIKVEEEEEETLAPPEVLKEYTSEEKVEETPIPSSEETTTAGEEAAAPPEVEVPAETIETTEEEEISLDDAWSILGVKKEEGPGEGEDVSGGGENEGGEEEEDKP